MSEPCVEALIAKVRWLHGPRDGDPRTCADCREQHPCDALQLADALEALRAEVAKLKGWK